MQAEPRHILFVLGMHRSGTSALCAALQASGASFGGRLLEPMDGVNAEGFWEDAELVEINEALLRIAGSEWYGCSADLVDRDWSEPAFDEQRTLARQVLQRGFGDGPVEAAKDPRLCLTLPFWLDLCAGSGIPTSVCVASRAPMEVARSLERRDGFPLGYGLRLYQLYRTGIARHAPDDAVYLTYDQLLADPVDCMQRLARQLPLDVSEKKLAAVVRADLRHHEGATTGGALYEADTGTLDGAALEAAIVEFSPVQRTLGDLAERLVGRGAELTEIGSAHTAALATLDQRDTDIERLSGEHKAALATIQERDEQISGLDRRLAETGDHLASALAIIDERDEQIAEFDRRLSKLGEEHSYALDLIRSRDEQLQRCFDKPGIGLLFKAMWKHEQR